MTSLTVAVLFRPGCPYRERHFPHVQGHLRRAFPDARHVVVGTDHQPYNRAAARNAAMIAGKDSDVVLVSDADLMAGHDAMRAAVEGAASDGRLHKPFIHYRASTQRGMERYYRGIPFDKVPLQDETDYPPGGILVMKPERWFDLGGMDERFTAWGFEDTAFMAVIDTLGGGAVYHRGNLDHLWHPRGFSPLTATYKANKALFSEYETAMGDPDAMRALIRRRDRALAEPRSPRIAEVVPQKRRLSIALVAHAVYPFLKAGSEVMLHQLARTLNDAGHDATVCGFWDEAGTTIEGGVRVFGGREGRRHWRHGRYDAVVVHHKESRRVIPEARQRGIPSALIIHGPEPWSREYINLGPDLIIYNTEWVRDSHGKPGIIVHPPMRPEQHETAPGDAITLINVTPPKGSDVFYQLARRMPDVQFLGVRGGYGRQVIEGLPNVTIIDSTTDMRRDVWAKTSILLMPSETETYGLAGVEALASGIPVIAAPVGGLREALGNGGIFIDRNDIDSWESQIRVLLSYPDRMEQARTAARARVAELNTEQELASFVEAIERLASEKRQVAAA